MLPTSFLFIFMASLTVYASPTTNDTRDVHQLLARQSPLDPNNIPPRCNDRCAHSRSTLNDCAAAPRPACGCSLVDENANVDCLNCLLFGIGVPDPDAVRTVQADIDEYVRECDAAGFNLPFTTLSQVPSQHVVSTNPTQTPPSPITLSPSSSSPVPSMMNSEAKNSVPVVRAAAVAAALLGFLFH